MNIIGIEVILNVVFNVCVKVLIYGNGYFVCFIDGYVGIDIIEDDVGYIWSDIGSCFIIYYSVDLNEFFVVYVIIIGIYEVYVVIVVSVRFNEEVIFRY